MKRLLLIILTSAISFGCSNDDSPAAGDLGHLKTCASNSGCDDCVIIDRDLYNETSTSNYGIGEVKINGNCIEITFSAGGCDGDTWETELIDMGDVAESKPGQRYVRMRLIDKEECEAYITKTVSFNIAPLQVDDGELFLNIEGWEELVLYSY